MRRTVRVLASVTLLVGFAASAQAGRIIVGSGSSFDLGTGSLDLGCGDLIVAGTLSAATTGIEGARDVTIAQGGVVNGDSASIDIAGDWSNFG